MTWREKIVIRVLLIVARMFADAPGVDEEIKALSTHLWVTTTRTLPDDGEAPLSGRLNP